MSAATRAFATMNGDEKREKERLAIMYEEQTVTEFTVDAEVETVMTDFYQKPYAEVTDVDGQPAQTRYAQAVNYYDNDDGFWDDYLDYKQ